MVYNGKSARRAPPLESDMKPILPILLLALATLAAYPARAEDKYDVFSTRIPVYYDIHNRRHEYGADHERYRAAIDGRREQYLAPMSEALAKYEDGPSPLDSIFEDLSQEAQTPPETQGQTLDLTQEPPSAPENAPAPEAAATPEEPAPQTRDITEDFLSFFKDIPMPGLGKAEPAPPEQSAEPAPAPGGPQ